MKKIVFVFGLLAASSALAADLEGVALERLSYELASASTTESRADSVTAYLDTLDHLGLVAKSTGSCLSFALKGMTSDLCRAGKVVARSSGGAGTGGAD